MAKKIERKSTDRDELSDLIVSTLNKAQKDGAEVACFLDGKDDPQMVSDWISTGSTLLDLAISNRPDGGLPVGRIVELNGLEGTGKSLIAAHIIADTQRKGGQAVMIDTEYAAAPAFWTAVGVDLKNMVYCRLVTVEEIFTAIENIIGTVRKSSKDRLCTIVVDSLAQASSTSEMESEHGTKGYNTQKAIIISMALRKITGLIGSQRILVVFTNQLRMNMDAKAFGDKYCVCPFTTKIKIKYKKPDRVKKISIAAKRMWKNAKNNNLDLVHRMLNSSKNKNYDLNGYKMNAPEYQIGLILNDLKLNWKYESVFNFKKCCYLPDFSIDSLKLIVECYGDFWHANPKYFKPTDTTHKNRTALQVWEYDEKKKETFESNGYKYFYFWESDIMECPNEIKKEIKKEIYENIRRRNFNNWLENKAIEAENYPTIGNEHRYPTDDNYNQTWAKYFRSLKNIHLQNTFIIGGFDITNSPLLKYLDYHINEYNVLHETGSITYSKK